MEIQEQWSNVLNKMSSEISALNFDLWIKNIEPVDLTNDTLVIATNTNLAKDQISSHFMSYLTKFVQEEFGGIFQIQLLTPDEKAEYLKYNAPKSNVEMDSFVEHDNCEQFNPKYTFENFVVGQSNKFVFLACKTVAEHPAARFNPLFIYGGVGLGKTHLLHAIGNYIKKTNPKIKIVYITCENLLNDFISSIKYGSNSDNTMLNFRKKYRDNDVLMIDDIQFISKKVGLQEEVFHMFNDLHAHGKQIIFSSDRHPSEISALDERLKSRFSSGLTQDVQTPDFETRLAILKKKASLEKYDIEDDALSFIAEKIDSNIREMEGALAKVFFYANLKNLKVATLQEAKEALANGPENNKEEALNSDRVIDAVCDYFKVQRQDIVGKKKTKEIVSARQICVYLMTELLNMPLKAIGEVIGGRDHTTIMYSRDKVAKEINEKTTIATAVKDLTNALTNK